MKKLFAVIILVLSYNLVYAQTTYWKTIDLGTTVDLYGVNSKFVVGNNGKIFYTGNGGLNWAEQQSNTASGLRSVASNSIFSATLAVGLNGTIVRSTNSGVSWDVINSGTSNNLYSVVFSTNNYCFIAGANGIILKSTNAGLNWVTMNSGTSSDLYSIGGVTSVFSCGSGGVVRTLTTIIDTVWQSRNVGQNITLNSILSSGSNITAAGNSGKIFRSTNSGVNWLELSSPTINNLTSISGAYIVGYAGTVLNSVSGSWINFPGITNTDLLSTSVVSGAILGNPFQFITGKSGKLLTLQSDTSYFYRDLNGNNIRAWFNSRGFFDHDVRTNNTPGFEWPIGTGKYAIFTAGLTIAAYVNNGIRMASASYSGEYLLGYCSTGIFLTNNTFRIYRITRGDNPNSNRDWNEWSLMVPFGAPFKDNNNNGTYEPSVDIPGVKDAKQTIFMCLSDANPSSHTPSSGFGGGTLPLGAEVHLTAWCYDDSGYEDIQFLKWEVINKSLTAWDSTIFSIVSDPDLGDAGDDYIGCDSLRSLGYCYNADNIDGDGTGITYGINPPASGFMFLNCSGSNSIPSSICYFGRSGSPGPPCERDPNNSMEAYNYINGTKSDRTPWVIPYTNPPQTTKFIYSGDPETNSGWTEFTGRIHNCGGSLTGQVVTPSPAGDRRLLLNYKSSLLRINPGSSQVILAAQLIARGTNNLNSVTRLKSLADVAKNLCQNGFVIGINPISSEIPNKFSLHQNYPNPFNPITKIKFDLPKSGNVIVKIYDAIGREITTLVNDKLNAGIYSVDWNAANYPSGVYFYRLTSGSYTETKKMVLTK